MIAFDRICPEIAARETRSLFQRFVLDAPYRLRLRRHYNLFKSRLERSPDQPAAPSKNAASE